MSIGNILVYVALAGTLNMHGVLDSMLFMGAFALGTFPIMSALAITGYETVKMAKVKADQKTVVDTTGLLTDVFVNKQLSGYSSTIGEIVKERCKRHVLDATYIDFLTNAKNMVVSLGDSILDNILPLGLSIGVLLSGMKKATLVKILKGTAKVLTPKASTITYLKNKSVGALRLAGKGLLSVGKTFIKYPLAGALLLIGGGSLAIDVLNMGRKSEL